MKSTYEKLFDGNRKWVEDMLEMDPGFFEKLSKGQKPPVLWIGCSDSRVPANEITGTLPGEIFVHRNIANMVVHTDLSMLSVVDYAVNVLGVTDVIVCGHYGCGGVMAALGNKPNGLVDNWLRNIKDVYRLHQREMDSIRDVDKRAARLVELNVIEQVFNLTKTTIIQNAWSSGKQLAVHGLVYDIANGVLNDLKVSVSDKSELPKFYVMDPVVN
ncbi:carbonate dehydratase [Sediminibacterium roseum]|uniref:carbonic anhydrase n=1 Tax=Sediminibacterium roseum TaxID=1978412 RepID=A0ABW9ZXN1_9BACT|nr:carbonate dehydratase [Sediminibacterium roseum]NCI51929.1 carbonate dehydratase [Sediminibacterium roseum]